MKEIIFTSVLVFWILVIIVTGNLGFAIYRGELSRVDSPNSITQYTSVWNFLFDLMTFQVEEMGAISTFLLIMNILSVFVIILIIRGN